MSIHCHLNEQDRRDIARSLDWAIDGIARHVSNIEISLGRLASGQLQGYKDNLLALQGRLENIRKRLLD